MSPRNDSQSAAFEVLRMAARTASKVEDGGAWRELLSFDEPIDEVTCAHLGTGYLVPWHKVALGRKTGNLI